MLNWILGYMLYWVLGIWGFIYWARKTNDITIFYLVFGAIVGAIMGPIVWIYGGLIYLATVKKKKFFDRIIIKRKPK
jgi:multisubunit Na+/H+ antiporter MnhE subunit